jgi:hypothetical protein
VLRSIPSFKVDGGTTSFTIAGTLGAANLSSGYNFGIITQYDAGGIQTDGGTFPDMLAYGSFLVPDGGWLDGGLRGYFSRLIRYDGGTLTTTPIYDNT